MINCPLCLSQVIKLKTNSHVIPRWMLVQIKQNGKLKKITSDQGSRWSQADQMGDIVCDYCEQRFTLTDTFSVDFFRHKKYFVGSKSILEANLTYKVNFHLAAAKQPLSLFFVGILLRSHLYLSKYERTNLLGPYYEILRTQFLLGSIDLHRFPFMMLQYEKLGRAHEYPALHKIDNVHFQRFMLFGHQILIKVSNKAGPEELSSIVEAEEIVVPVDEGFNSPVIFNLVKLIKKFDP